METNREKLVAEIEELYNQLTPENKAKARAKYYELLREQEEEEKRRATV